MKVKVVNQSFNELPDYQTEGSAGMDLRANIKEPLELEPLERKLVPTGLFIELPQGYEAQVRPRSGLSLKHGVTVLNAPGTIDADYRGEIGVILINLSDKMYLLEPGERIAQIVVTKYERIEWEQTGELLASERAAGGFGSTGNQ